MNKYFWVLAILLGSVYAHAQVSQGGTPLSFDPAYSDQFNAQQNIPIVSLPAPDIIALKKEDSTQGYNDGLIRIGSVAQTNVDFSNSGSVTYLNDGRKVWRLTISIPGMQALGLYYDKFHLPQGVKYFVFNANGRQVIGAYTADNDPEDGQWANEKVQGDVVNLEMDIDANVNLADVQMHIYGVCAFYRASSYLKAYELGGANFRTTGTYYPYDSSSPCEINAACSLGRGYDNQINATVHIEYLNAAHTFAYAGTGFMVNNTSGDCTPYLLTASHVEPTNSTSNTTFSNWIFYYNYQAPRCAYSGPQPITTHTMVGATFAIRSSFDSSSSSINHDFLLLKLKKRPPLSYSAYLAGWDRTTVSSLFPISGTYISFHHPDGDIKKVATATSADPRGNFNGGGTNTHWAVNWSQGGTEEGSSGSALFNGNGRAIGILSGGNVNSPACTTPNSSGQEMADFAVYSKLSYNWTAGGYPSGTLMSWLDPTNSNVNTLDGMTSCPPEAVAQVSVNSGEISLYPNPTAGIAYVELNGNNANLKIEVYNVLGEKQMERSYLHPGIGEHKLDLSTYPAGVYLVRITADNTIVTKQLVLSH